MRISSYIYLSNTAPTDLAQLWAKPVGNDTYSLQIFNNGAWRHLVGIGSGGKSAYELAVEEEGYTGTLEEWLLSLKGAQGPVGPQGEQGPQGNSGYSGAASELEVVNNLTDGGETAALSAEQGKILNNKIETEFGPKIDHIKGGTFDSWEWVESKYINGAGGVTTSSNLKYSKPVKVYKGDVVHVNGAGVGIAAIAKVITEDSSYTNLVSMTDGKNAKDYYWTATEDCYVAISGRYNRESGNVDGDITFVSQFTSKADGDTLTENVARINGKVDSLFGKDPIYGEATNTSGSTTFKEGITLDAGKYTFHCVVEGNSGDVYVRLQKDGSNVASTTMTTSRRDYSFDFELDEKKEGLCYNIYGTTTFVSIEITPHFKGYINALVNGDIANSDITALNPSAEFDAKIAQLARRENVGSGGWKQPPFVLAHFSDIHGDGDNTKRILDFCDRYKDYIDEIIHTGDIVSNYYEDDFTFWATAGADDVLNTIGNHDVWEQNGSTTGHVGKDAYDKFIAPYVANWNVVQPTNAATLGLCYYYKDYTKTQSSMTTKIRLVVLDPMAYDSAQNTWLVSVLADALTNGFSVIVASHYKGGVMDYDTDCTFCSLKDISNEGTYTNNDAASAIDDFIDDGGDFVCWIAGHTHYDQFGVLHNHPRQVCVVIDSANDVASSYSGDSPRIEGTKSQDAFNLMSVDTYTHTFRIVRVGNNMDRYLRQKNVLAYDYKAMKVIYNA